MIPMNLNKKFFALIIFIIFISIVGAYCTPNHQNSDLTQIISNENYINGYLTQLISNENYINGYLTQLISNEINSDSTTINETKSLGCCSIVLQLDNNESIMTYRRDSNLTADVFIEKVNWHGIPAIKQYKKENGYFNHVIITNDGWVIGLGGLDDGSDSEICEHLTTKMITEDGNINKDYLSQIQKIKKQYGRGHVVIKAPNGNYGFATPTKMKTGKLNPGEYISIPNDYELSRRGNISLDSEDKIEAMVNLSQSDLYGEDRRDIFTYDIHLSNETNTTDIYVANEDGSLIERDFKDCVDNVIFNSTRLDAKDIPIAPKYKKLGFIEFNKDEITVSDSEVALIFFACAILIIILFSIVLKIIRFVKYRVLKRGRKNKNRNKRRKRKKMSKSRKRMNKKYF